MCPKKTQAHAPKVDAFDDEEDFNDSRRLDTREQDVLLRGPVAGVADAVQ